MTRRFDRQNGSPSSTSRRSVRCSISTSNSAARTTTTSIFRRSPHSDCPRLRSKGIPAHGLQRLAANCDDHTKNLSFLMDESGKWQLAPAYDVTHAYNPKGEWTYQHLMSVEWQIPGHHARRSRKPWVTVSDPRLSADHQVRLAGRRAMARLPALRATAG